MKIVTVLCGSRLYGNHTDESDHDLRSVVIPPIEELFGLRGETNRAVHTKNETTDHVVYDLRHFLQLSYKGNPNILEMWFAGIDYIENWTLEWDRLIEFKEDLISQSAVRAHLGWARKELKQLQELEEPANFKKRLFHVYRILHNTTSMISWGTFNPTLGANDIWSFNNILDNRLVSLIMRDYEDTAERLLNEAVERLPQKARTDRIERLALYVLSQYVRKETS